MKRTLFLFALILCSCSGNRTKQLTGSWIEQKSNTDVITGIELKSGGDAERIGLESPVYDRWAYSGGKLILAGETTDTMSIASLNNDTLVLLDQGRKRVFVRRADRPDTEPFGERPSRAPHEGFEWQELTGAGLRLWVQSNDRIRLVADPALPGIVMVRDGDNTPRMLIRIFDLPDNDINDVIDALSATPGWDKSQTCRFEEVKSPRNGVRRYALVPDGEYAVQTGKLMKSEPLPAPCNGWGVGNSGTRYFEIHESRPDKAIFMEIGQEAPLFDENSVVFTENTARPEDELTVLGGTVRIGHEVRSFCPDGSDMEFWIVDKTGRLNEAYDKITGGIKNGKPAHATLKVEYNGKWDDGFAAEYSGVYFVREVIAIQAE